MHAFEKVSRTASQGAALIDSELSLTASPPHKVCIGFPRSLSRNGVARYDPVAT
jgi:hypothetical protein